MQSFSFHRKNKIPFLLLDETKTLKTALNNPFSNTKKNKQGINLIKQDFKSFRCIMQSCMSIET